MSVRNGSFLTNQARRLEMLHKDVLEKIVGVGNVWDDETTIEAYSSNLSFIPRIRAACLVKPGNAQEVQSIVNWANETSTPLVPVSSGGPHRGGDTVPSTGGAVVVDLSRMNQILRIDRRNRVCMIEPGVTFEQLVPRLAGGGIQACNAASFMHPCFKRI
jgi:FAD/FMN-containing dehydrogenase